MGRAGLLSVLSRFLRWVQRSRGNLQRVDLAPGGAQEAAAMRATLQKLKLLQLDSGKEQDNVVLPSSSCFICV